MSLTALNLVAQLSAWPTAQSRDGANSRSGMPERTGGRRRNLDDYATLAAWATPNATDCESAGGPQQTSLTNQATGRYVLGPTSNGSPAATEKPGQLNAAFSLWLMGYPVAAWLLAAPSPTRASPKNKRPTDSVESAS